MESSAALESDGNAAITLDGIRNVVLRTVRETVRHEIAQLRSGIKSDFQEELDMGLRSLQSRQISASQQLPPLGAYKRARSLHDMGAVPGHSRSSAKVAPGHLPSRSVPQFNAGVGCPLPGEVVAPQAAPPHSTTAAAAATAPQESRQKSVFNASHCLLAELAEENLVKAPGDYRRTPERSQSFQPALLSALVSSKTVPDDDREGAAGYDVLAAADPPSESRQRRVSYMKKLSWHVDLKARENEEGQENNNALKEAADEEEVMMPDEPGCRSDSSDEAVDGVLECHLRGGFFSGVEPAESAIHAPSSAQCAPQEMRGIVPGGENEYDSEESRFCKRNSGISSKTVDTFGTAAGSTPSSSGRMVRLRAQSSNAWGSTWSTIGSPRMGHGSVDEDSLEHKWRINKLLSIRAPGAFGCIYYLGRFVREPIFDYIVILLIICNAITIGVQTDYSMRNFPKETPATFNIIETVFVVLFAVELSLRIIVYGTSFFTGADWKWNMFDFTIVSMQIVEEVIMAVSGGDGQMMNFNFVRILRILRLVRIARLVRLLRFIQELRTMVASIAASFRSLLWTMVLLCLMMYVLGVYLTQLVADHGLSNPQNADDDQDEIALKHFYGDLPRSILSLYQAMTGGVDWDSVLTPLMDRISPYVAIVFVAYISFAVLAMMNVVTGIFVESALLTAKADKEAELLSQVRRTFQKADANTDGQISWEEFVHELQDPGLEKYFKALDIDMTEARGLFLLLDTDESGTIEAEEFIQGCLRLGGPAKSIDLATLMYFNKRMMNWWKVCMGEVEQNLLDIFETLDNIEFGVEQNLKSLRAGAAAGPAARTTTGTRKGTCRQSRDERFSGSSECARRGVRPSATENFATWSDLKQQAELRMNYAAVERARKLGNGHLVDDGILSKGSSLSRPTGGIDRESLGSVVAAAPSNDSRSGDGMGPGSMLESNEVERKKPSLPRRMKTAVLSMSTKTPEPNLALLPQLASTSPPVSESGAGWGPSIGDQAEQPNEEDDEKTAQHDLPGMMF